MDAARRTSPDNAVRFGLLKWIGFGALLVYAVFCWTHASIQPGGADSSGYFNMAQAILRGQVHVPARTIESLPMRELPVFAYTPLGLRPTGDGTTLTPTYPLGLPLFFAATGPLLGWSLGPKLVMVLHALAGLWLVYALARQAGTSQLGALLAAAAMAVSPLYIMFWTQAMSDLPALVWCAAALWFAGRRTTLTAALAGVAIGVAVLVRPSNVLVAAPVLIALGFSLRRWIALGLGGIPTALVVLFYNRAAYGGELATGYGNVWALFSTEWVGITLRHYAQWLPALLSPLCVLALGSPWLKEKRGPIAVAHGVWVVALLAFYASYYHTHETWWYLRFVLPAFPSLVILAVLVGEQLVARLSAPGKRTVLAAIAVVAVIANGIGWTRHFAAHEVGRGEKIYLDAIRLAREGTPTNAVVVTMQASGALFYGTDRVLVRWDTIDDAWPRVVAGAHASGRPLYAVLFDYEWNEAFNGNIPGKWTKLEQHQNLALWRFEPTP
jgi:hypothetical protein